MNELLKKAMIGLLQESRNNDGFGNTQQGRRLLRRLRDLEGTEPSTQKARVLPYQEEGFNVWLVECRKDEDSDWKGCGFFRTEAKANEEAAKIEAAT